MKQQELATALDNLTAQQGKIAKEQSDRFDAVTAKLAELQTAIEAGDATPEVTSALAALQKATDSLDQAVPDAPTA